MFDWVRKRHERREARKGAGVPSSEHKLSQEHSMHTPPPLPATNSFGAWSPNKSGNVPPPPRESGTVQRVDEQSDQQDAHKLIMPHDPAAQETLKHAPEVLGKAVPPQAEPLNVPARRAWINPVQKLIDESKVVPLVNGLGNLSSQMTELHGTLEKLADELNESTSGVTRLNEPLTDVASPAQELGKVIPDVEDQLNEITPSLASLPADLKVLQATLAELPNDLKTLQNTIAALPDSLQHLETSATAISDQIAPLADDLTRTQKTLAALDDVIPELTTNLSMLPAALTALQKQTVSINNNLSSLRGLNGLLTRLYWSLSGVAVSIVIAAFVIAFALAGSR